MKDKLNPSSGLSKEELKPFYLLKSTPELLEMLYHRDQYTVVAVELVLEELHARKVTGKDFQEFDVARIVSEYEERKREHIYGLNIWEKFGCYLVVPLLFPIALLVYGGITKAYSDKGFRIKAKQANIFMWISFLSLALGAVCKFDIYIVLLVWAVFFFVAAWLNGQMMKKINANNLRVLNMN